MPKTHRIYNKDFKAKVALESLSGLLTIEQIASKYEIHPIMVSKWKKKLLEDASNVFEADKKYDNLIKEKDEHINKLYQTVGQREYELAWLKKNMGIK